ncbi:hypothetical protein GGR51DRAFT_563128 [Nemania sp. FL0031]|nr:hypothetical protein GGR51DRAFT_563128 [Nemania sp. FL0031]
MALYGYKAIPYFRKEFAGGHDSFSPWFAKCKYTHDLNRGTIIRHFDPIQAGAERPLIDALPAQHKFASQDELSVALAYGSSDQHDTEQAYINARNAPSFECNYVGLKNFKSPGDLPEAFMLIGRANSKELKLLPPKGRKIKCHVEGVERQVNEPRTADKVEHFFQLLSGILLENTDSLTIRNDLNPLVQAADKKARDQIIEAFIDLNEKIREKNTTNPQRDLRTLITNHIDMLSIKNKINIDEAEQNELE